MMNVDEYIKQYFYEKDVHCLLKEQNINSFDYIKESFLNSVEFIEMIADLEDKFSITFTDKDMSGAEFCTIGGLIKTIERLSALDV